MDESSSEFKVPGPYWGPFPGETPELYERIGVMWVYNEALKPYFPKFFIGDFSIKHGVDASGKSKRAELEASADIELPTKTESLTRYTEWTKKNEKIHLWGFLGFTALNKVLMETLDMQNAADKAFVIGFAVCNVAVNIYPIMLQRHNRLRAYRELSSAADD